MRVITMAEFNKLEDKISTKKKKIKDEKLEKALSMIKQITDAPLEIKKESDMINFANAIKYGMILGYIIIFVIIITL